MTIEAVETTGTETTTGTPSNRSTGLDTFSHAVYVFTGVLFVAFSGLVARSGSSPTWEATWFRQINDTNATTADVFWWVMQLGTVTGVLIAVVGLLAFGSGPSRWISAGTAACASLLAWLTATGMKSVVERPRPVELLGGVRIFRETVAGSYGWPSAHTAVAFALATVIALAVPTWARWLPLTVATLVGFARIIMGAHFPLDVIGGAGIGIVIGSVIDLAAKAVAARGRVGSGGLSSPD
jgi:undecaprenyl-diphosphatase